MKRILIVFAWVMTAIVAFADDMDQFVPANWGNWKNLSVSVNDLTYYDKNPLPMQAAVSGKTIHVAWPDWKANADGYYCLYYRRSADGGKTWENARAVVSSPNMSMVDINYVGSGYGSNAKWMEVNGDHVHFVNVLKSEDGENSVLLYTYSNDGGQTFQQRILAEGSEGDGHYSYGRPHVVSDGQTVVIAFQQGRYGSSPYHVRVFTSFDGGATFEGHLIETTQELVDLKVSGTRWTVLGNDMYWYQNMWWGNVYLSTSTDGGENISTQNIAPLVKDDTSWCSLEYMKGYNGDAFNYHPQMTLEGDVINVIFKGCAVEVEGTHPTNDRSHTIFRRSTDGGETWTDAMYLPESIGTPGTIAAKGQNIYVLQTPNGPIMYHSHDGGKTWDIQYRCYWDGRYDGYSNFYELYIAPDDPTGQHVYMTGTRALLVETKDGFRSVHRNFALGTESWFGGRNNNHSLTVLLDSEGTEHWVMNYQAPYESNDYFWNIVYRRNDPLPATGDTNMALDISKIEDQVINKPLTNVTVPMTPSIYGTKDATTVECWVRVDKPDYTTEIASLTNKLPNHQGSYYQGGWYINLSVNGDWYSFSAGVSTEQSVDGHGKEIWDRWRYQIKDAGMWHHLALTYDSNVENDNIRFYIDGVLMGTATEIGPLAIGNNPVMIGKATTYGSNQVFVDNFAIFDRALTQEEVRAHIYQAPTGKEGNCCLLLTFDGSLQDKSQYHNDPVPLMDAILAGHDGIRPPHPDFTLTRDANSKTVYANDVTQDGEGVWWVLPYPGNFTSYKTSEQRHVSQDFSRDPGTYEYTLVTKGKGDCNAYASASKTITIGGLNRVEPRSAGRSEVVALRVWGGYTLNENARPTVQLRQGSTLIDGTWIMSEGYDHEKMLSLDDIAYAVFDLSNAPLGMYDVLVNNLVLANGFELEAPEEPNVWMEVNGWDRMLIKKPKDFSIDYGNSSNVDAYNVPVYLFIPEARPDAIGDGGTVIKEEPITFGFDFDVMHEELLEPEAIEWANNELGVYQTFSDPRGGGKYRCYSFMIPYIPAHGKGHKRINLRYFMTYNTDDAMTVDVVYMIGQPWGPFIEEEAATRGTRAGGKGMSRETAECLMEYLATGVVDAAAAAVPFGSCVWGAGKTLWQGFSPATKDRWSTLGTNLFSTAFSCAMDANPLGWGWRACQLANIAFSTAMNIYSAKGCQDGDGKDKKIKLVSSYDPNEMIGPSGYDDNAHYIKPIHNMSYTITYENKSTATAPAHEVFVNDKLDLSKFIPESFCFTSFGWADQVFYVDGALTQEFTRDVPYNVNGQDIIVRVSGSFDKETGVANWSMVSLDSKGNEIDDPDLGYLLPNNDDHVGEGFVTFSIEHKPNPANGSTISNKATIVFDANDPIETNTFVNTFDTDYPTSGLTSIEKNGTTMIVKFAGNDDTSGVGSYDLYVFKDGAEAELLAAGISANQYQFETETNVTYAFCVIARDNVGWMEAKDLKPEYLPGTAETISISKAKQLAYVSGKDLNFKMASDLKAYVATGYDKTTGTIWLSRVYDVPAKTGILLMGEQGNYDVPIEEAGSNSYYKNMFKGTLTGTTIYTTDGNYTNYYLSNGAEGVGFYKVNKEEGVKLSANRAYLPIPTVIDAVGEAGSTVAISVGGAEQVPYYSDQSLDFTEMADKGMKAYTATGYDYATGTIWLSRVKQVPAETGVLIMAPKGNYDVPTVSVASVYENMFFNDTATTEIYTEEDDFINYYLSNGAEGVGFYKVTKEGGVALGKNRCYLQIPKVNPAAASRSAEASQISADLNSYSIGTSETIGIQLLSSTGGNGDGTTNLRKPVNTIGEPDVYYNLNGQRVDKPGKGLYIRNGKMVIIK